MNEERENFKEKYKKELEAFFLPEKVRKQYDAVKCLKDGKDTWTILLKDRLTGGFCVIKQGTGVYTEFLKREYDFLRELREKGLRGIPRPYCLIEEGENLYFLREYIEGRTLYEIAQNHDFSKEEICEVGISLCRIVEQLHDMEKPLLHRDIKPENIVCTPDGQYMLIDFGTERYYKEGKKDTFLVGTEGTAAPEQYGFNQTDKRTDIYAIGETLCYLASGTYDTEALSNVRINRKLKKIIKKAAAFDPAKRYADAGDMEKALLRCIAPKKHRGFAGTGVVFLFGLLALRLLFFEKEITEKSITFQEPLVEEAVRSSLKLDEDTAITEEMLRQIKSLRIVGEKILGEEDVVETRGWMYVNNEAQNELEKGSICSLADFSYMENLTELVICRQNIRSLSPLENLPIEMLNLYGNDILEVTALDKLPKLSSLVLGENPCTDMEILGKCFRLKSLNLDSMIIQNLDFLESLALEECSILDTRVAMGGLDKLLTQDKLRILSKNEITLEDTEVLCRMKNLIRLNCYHSYEGKNLEPLKGMDKLNMIVMRDGLQSLEGIENLPALQYLHIQGSQVTDLSPVKKASSLLHLGIGWLDIQDYTPVRKAPVLEEIYCTGQQKEEIMKAVPDIKVKFVLEG